MSPIHRWESFRRVALVGGRRARAGLGGIILATRTMPPLGNEITTAEWRVPAPPDGPHLAEVDFQEIEIVAEDLRSIPVRKLVI